MHALGVSLDDTQRELQTYGVFTLPLHEHHSMLHLLRKSVGSSIGLCTIAENLPKTKEDGRVPNVSRVDGLDSEEVAHQSRKETLIV